MLKHGVKHAQTLMPQVWATLHPDVEALEEAAAEVAEEEDTRKEPVSFNPFVFLQLVYC